MMMMQFDKISTKKKKKYILEMILANVEYIFVYLLIDTIFICLYGKFFPRSYDKCPDDDDICCLPNDDCPR